MVEPQLMAKRKAMFDKLEKRFALGSTPKEDAFYFHSSEDRIVLSHALFWVMTQNMKGHVAKERYFLLLRQYQEEMLEAYLTVSDQFSELLHYCNLTFNLFPQILTAQYNILTDKDARKLSGIFMVAGGYGGDMPEELVDELLDDIDFYYNHVKCRKIEQMLPQLYKRAEAEIQDVLSNS